MIDFLSRVYDNRLQSDCWWQQFFTIHMLTSSFSYSKNVINYIFNVQLDYSTNYSLQKILNYLFIINFISLVISIITF